MDDHMDSNGREHGETNDVITVNDVTLGYGKRTVLENVSFTVEKGDIFAIIGPSGCGKSTLLNAIIGLIPVNSGRIVVAGEEITQSEDEEALRRARKNMGVLFQSGALLDWMTIGENIAFPMREFTDLPDDLIEQMVKIKLGMVDMDNQADRMPSELSGGMVRRAGLAIAMALDPPILFCDEPSSGLDPVTAKEMDELLIEFNNYFNVTVVVVTHEVPSLENIATRCIMLDKKDKGIIASGTFAEVKNQKDDRRVQRFFERRTDKKPRKRDHDPVQ